MYNYTDGFYEIEFQRTYRQQGQVLYRIRHREKRLKCYLDKREELSAQGIFSSKLSDRIEFFQDRLNKAYALRDRIEAYKEEISINNPENSVRAEEAKIISEAYERAYAPEMPVKNGVWDKMYKFIFGRCK